MRFFYGLFLVLWCIRPVAAQRDSSLLHPERLEEKDILVRTVGVPPTLCSAVTRSEEAVEDLPYTVWVIKSEDILRYGFVTLGDVLRAAPGIRVSQPGNALEGETFLMRGLAGNQYVKVLINDVPIKPANALGIPIGAQLPVRQAERIEVVYGPMGAVHGDEACAGVINIIMKENERPLYTQADLSVGNFGYNSLDLMFGGKLFKGKNLFRFNIYGSNTIRDWFDFDYIYDKNGRALAAENYVPFGFDSTIFYRNPAFDDYFPGGSNTLPRIGTLSHESRLVGLNATWRGIQIQYNRMTRSDHAGLGLNPFAISWEDPGDRLPEVLTTLSLAVKRAKKRRVTHYSLSIVDYSISRNSNITHYYDATLKDIYRSTATGRNDRALLDTLFKRYGAQDLYAASSDWSLRADLFSKIKFNRNLSWKIYGNWRTLGGDAYKTYDKVFDGFRSSDGFTSYNLGTELNAGTGLEWKSKRWFATADLLGRLPLFSGDNLPPPALIPRAAVLFRIDSAWALRANAAIGFKDLGGYAQSGRTALLDTMTKELLYREYADLAREETRGYEFGVRYTDDMFFELLFFKQQAYHLFRPAAPRVDTFQIDGQERVLLATGSQSDPGISQSLWGLQLLYRTDNQKITEMGRRQKAEVTGRLEFFLQYARGQEYKRDGTVWQTEIFGQPRWHRQFRAVTRFGKLEFIFASNSQTSTLNKAVGYKGPLKLTRLPDRSNKFRTWDMSARLYLSKYFVLYCQAQNVFNRTIPGLEATGTSDDLVPNIQPGRFVRFGVNYNMN